MSLGAIGGFLVRAVMPRRVALLADDAEVAELERTPSQRTDHGRAVAVQQLAAMQLAQHLQDARNLAAAMLSFHRRSLRREIAAQIAVRRVLEHQAVLRSFIVLRHDERVEAW